MVIPLLTPMVYILCADRVAEMMSTIHQNPILGLRLRKDPLEINSRVGRGTCSLPRILPPLAAYTRCIQGDPLAGVTATSLASRYSPQ